MGLLYFRRDDDGDTSRPPAGSDHQSNKDAVETTRTVTLSPLLIAVVVIGILIIATLAGLMLVHYIKSRRRQRKQSKTARYWLERQPIDDQERRMMIRKSLASRSSLVTSSDTPQAQAPSSVPDREHHPEDSATEQGEMTSLREDWKAWEARVQSERRSSNPGGVGLDQHPAFASHLSVPQPTRIPSPVRGADTLPAHFRFPGLEIDSPAHPIATK